MFAELKTSVGLNLFVEAILALEQMSFVHSLAIISAFCVVTASPLVGERVYIA